MSSYQADCGKPASKALFEKPSFSQTCSLLSQYLKEKGTLGDLSLCMSRNVEEKGVPEMIRPAVTPAMKLFPTNENPADFPQNLMKPMDLFPDPIGKDDLSKMADSNGATQKQPEPAQMTIFYAGQVVMFNDVPADKMKEIMMLARKLSISTDSNPHLAAFSGPNLVKNQMNPGVMIPPNPIQDRIQRPAAETIASDLPIARRASLHRFLEKRKDRITARSPYAAASTEHPPSKPSESKPWLGLAAQPTQ